MKLMIIGAGGFVGSALVKRLLVKGELLLGQSITRITALDMNLDSLPNDSRIVKVKGSFADDLVLTQALQDEPELIFHLASIPGGIAEANFELGLAVNLHATLNLFEKMRAFKQQAILVFTSSIAVYGAELSCIIDDNTPKKPHLSYGAHKYATEVILQDYCRRHWIDGRIIRLPGIVARPSQSSGLLSAYMSDIFWKISAGKAFTCPVSEHAVSWFMSQSCCIDNLLHAAQLSPAELEKRRDFTLPILRVTMKNLINALVARFGEERRVLIDFNVDKKLEQGFGSQPPLDATSAEEAGFKSDENLDNLINRALASV